MLLVYAAMGWPVRPIATLLRPPGATRLARSRRLAASAAATLLTRLILGTALLFLLAIPFAQVLAALVLAWRLAVAVRRPRGARPATQRGPPSALAEVVAGAINDSAANIDGLLGLALFARGAWRLLALGVLLAILFSLPAVAQAWRTWRAVAAVRIALGTLVAAGAGMVAIRDPAVATLAAGVPALGFIVPLAFGLAVAWRGGAVERLPLRQSPPQIPGT
jgi:hypothetical protein